MNHPKRRTQIMRIGMQLVYITVVPLTILLLILWFKGTGRNQLLSLLAGGFLCILFQAILLFKYFKHRIAKDDYDLVKIVKEQVESLFGLDPADQVDLKIRRKYYCPSMDVGNKLFDPQASGIFRDVVSQLRSKNEQNFEPRLNSIENKCLQIKERLKIMRHLYEFVGRNYKDTSISFQGIVQKMEKAPQSTFEFYSTRNAVDSDKHKKLREMLQLDDIHKATPRSLSWKQIGVILQQIESVYNASSKNIIRRCANLVLTLQKDIETNNTEIVAQLKKEHAAYIVCNSKVTDLQNRIKEQIIKIQSLEREFNKINKKHDNYEQQLNVQLNLQVGKVELSNLRIKESNAIDMRIKAAETLFARCQRADEQLVNYAGTLNRNSKTLYKQLLEIEIYIAKHALKGIKDAMAEDLKELELSAEYKSCHESNISFDETLNKFRLLVTEQEIHKTFLRNFFESVVVGDNKRCEYVLGYCAILEQELSRYPGEALLEATVINTLKDIVNFRYHFINKIRHTLQNVNNKAYMFQSYLKESKQEVSALESANKSSRRANLSSEARYSMELQLTRLVSSLRLFDMGDLQFQTELISAILEQLLHILHHCQTQLNSLEAAYVEPQPSQLDREMKFRQYESLLERDHSEGELPTDDITILNRLLDVFFEQWREGEYFHKLIEKQLYLALNLKRPDLLDQFTIEYLKIENKQLPLITAARSHPNTEVFHFLFDMDLQFVGDLHLVIKSKIRIRNGIYLCCNLLVKKFICPMRVCFTPFILGKSYVSFLNQPQLELDLQIRIGRFSLHKVPLLGTMIKALLVSKIRKMMLWPNRTSIKIPMSVKDTRIYAVRDRLQYMREKQSRNKYS